MIGFETGIVAALLVASKRALKKVPGIELPGKQGNSNQSACGTPSSGWERARALSIFNFGVEGFEFCTGIVDFELPGYAALFGIAVGLPGRGFRL